LRKHFYFVLVVASFLIAPWASCPAEEMLVIRGGMLVDVAQSEAQTPVTIVIEGGVILDVGLMDTEIQNGGIDQWIWNPGAERFAETCDALDTIGAQQVRHILDEVRNLFPSQAVPHSRRLRDYFRRINPTMQEEFERLSIVYFDLFESPADNLYQLLVDYWHHSR